MRWIGHVSQEREERTWWVMGSTSRKFAGALFVAGGALVLVALSSAGESWTEWAPLLPTLALVGSNWLLARLRTHAGPSGLVVTGRIRTRRIGWQDICDLDTGPAGRWATWLQSQAD